MNPLVARRWLHRFALLTAIMTLLLPVTTGALVTTLKAGMAFGDWPSSDGHFILTYPWFGSARDQFVEHGHRLSGMTIGILSMALASLALALPTGRTPKILGVSILVMVVIQGLLGGVRVLLDRDTLALIHGDFAAAVFSTMSVLVMVTSPFWTTVSDKSLNDSKTVSSGRTNPTGAQIAESTLQTKMSFVKTLSVLTFLAIVVQYMLGGFLRHLKVAWAWWLHPWFALVPMLLALALCFSVLCRKWNQSLVSRLNEDFLPNNQEFDRDQPDRFAISSAAKPASLLESLSGILLVFIIAQAGLGLMTWYVRYGVPSWGVVAQQESWQQVALCSLHKVLGMLTLMVSVLTMVCQIPRTSQSDARHSLRSRSMHSSLMGAKTLGATS